MLKKRFFIIRRLWKRLLRVLHLSPLSLAVKCQLMFGLAVVFTLFLALILPYIRMQQLVKQGYLDTERAKTDLLFAKHFQNNAFSNSDLTPLDNTGRVIDPNNPQVRWIRFAKENILEQEQVKKLTENQYETVKELLEDESQNDIIKYQKNEDVTYCNYVRFLRASDNCMSCHNEQEPASTFLQNELIGALITYHPISEYTITNLLNWVWLTVAGLIAGTGAIITFYWITQRVILRPIRQLRGMVNNVAEGNLDIRSMIKTGDEYERLADAFNHMLDGLQEAQEKLRNANVQLDAKISELSQRNIELFKANKIKSEFLANVSHEFRTPLNAILGFAQVLREKPLTLTKDKAERYADNIITGGNRLLNMINDLLELAKTRAGKIELHIEKASIPQLIESAVSSFSLETMKKEILVTTLVEENLPFLVSDAGKVQQIIYNFLSNAVKFTPKNGKIEINTSLKKDGKILCIAVTDNGCGIEDEDKEKIFEKFVTADSSLTRESSGTGLGLAISSELASLLAGKVGVESKIGEGSTFWLEIPIILSTETTQAQT
ncbi:MAG: HAMP domain-containing histidine kinase [Sedimentisphaerales bacterium]|nr:HAMP domain-containing histidine kinase [Sedimentisphaerales bacterium]